MAEFKFDATQVAPNTGGQDVLPTGVYDVIIVSSEMKPTKRNDGWYIEFGYSVTAGEYAGKRITDRINIQNPNQQAVEIGYGQLSALSHCVGKTSWQDTVELHQLPFKVRIEMAPRQDDATKQGNNVLGYLNVHGHDAQAIVSGAASSGGPTGGAAPAGPTGQPAAPGGVTGPAAPAATGDAAPPWASPGGAGPASPSGQDQDSNGGEVAKPPWATDQAAPSAPTS